MRKMWADEATKDPEVGATGSWKFFNVTADAHRVQVNEVAFE